MKKTSTPDGNFSDTIRKSRKSPSPRVTTLAFLRQFARVYCPAPAGGMPGIILN